MSFIGMYANAISRVEVEISLEDLFTDYSEEIVEFLTERIKEKDERAQTPVDCFFSELGLAPEIEKALREHLENLEVEY